MADRFPLYLPPDARRLFQTESLLRRFAQMAQWEKDCKLLELHASLGGLALVRALGGTLTVIDPEGRAVEAVRERARIAGVGPQVTISQGDPSALDFQPRSMNGIFCFGRVMGLPGDLAATTRPLLAEKGRIGFGCIVRVGRNPDAKVLAYWEERLGKSLPLPREALLEVEEAGFEPELIETVGETELDEYYKELETVLGHTPDGEGPAALREEIAMFRKHPATAAHAFFVARRKEPGEKPPLSRDSG